MFTINSEDGEEPWSPTSTSSVPPHVLVGSWSLVRANILLECLLVTFGRRQCCRVGLWQKRRGSRVEESAG
jgi:hypothetical protein